MQKYLERTKAENGSWIVAVADSEECCINTFVESIHYSKDDDRLFVYLTNNLEMDIPKDPFSKIFESGISFAVTPNGYFVFCDRDNIYITLDFIRVATVNRRLFSVYAKEEHISLYFFRISPDEIFLTSDGINKSTYFKYKIESDFSKVPEESSEDPFKITFGF